MKTPRLGFLFALGVAMGLALAISPAHADNRPAGELSLFTLLNGEVSRDLQSDGGGVSLWTSDAGIACATVYTGKVYEMHCSAAAHFCAWGDGGCSTTPSSQNYGRPIAASSALDPRPYYFVVQGDQTFQSTKLVCAIPSATAALTCPLFRMR